jgi:hypothetical protein
VLGNSTLQDAACWPGAATSRRHDCALQGRLGRIWWDQWGVYRAALDAGNDWLLLPKGFASCLRKPPVKLAVYVHDVMHDFYRGAHPGAVGRLEQAYFGRSLAAALRHGRVIFTNTEFTAQEVNRVAARAGLAPPPVVVAGIGFKRHVDVPNQGRRGIVVLASPFPHKRTVLAAEWMARWQEASGFHGDVDWVGGLPPGLSLPALPKWRQHGRLPEAEYRRLLAGARALVFFSDYEGFGMPPVEAGLAGACPVFSDLPATREVMGQAGFKFGNTDYESFRCALNSALEVHPILLAGWAEELLVRHDWARVAGRIVAGLRAVG